MASGDKTSQLPVEDGIGDSSLASDKEQGDVLVVDDAASPSPSSGQPISSTDSHISGGPDIEVRRPPRKWFGIFSSSQSRVIRASTPSIQKRSYMLSARQIDIVWGDGENAARRPIYINDSSCPFEVAKLVCPCYLKIYGHIGTSLLSPETNYVASLVYKLETDECYGGDDSKQETTIKFQGKTTTAAVSLESEDVRAHARGGGWKELKLGKFYNDKGDAGTVYAGLLGTGQSISCDVIVEGLGFAPEDAPNP